MPASGRAKPALMLCGKMRTCALRPNSPSMAGGGAAPDAHTRRRSAPRWRPPPGAPPRRGSRGMLPKKERGGSQGSRSRCSGGAPNSIPPALGASSCNATRRGMLADQARVIDQKRLRQRREVSARRPPCGTVPGIPCAPRRTWSRVVRRPAPAPAAQREAESATGSPVPQSTAERTARRRAHRDRGAPRPGTARGPSLRQRRLRQVGRQRVQLRPRHVHFARRVDRGVLQRRYRALRGRLEFAQLFDGVEVEHRAHRVLAVVGVDVDHLALDRELAMDRQRAVRACSRASQTAPRPRSDRARCPAPARIRARASSRPAAPA